MTGIAGTFAAPVGRLIRTPVIVFYDTENATMSNAIAFPCAQAVVTPSCYKKTIKGNHITYEGYHELAYLHPNYFSPDCSILKLLGVNEHEKYVIMRLVSWGAAHDVGHDGISLVNVIFAICYSLYYIGKNAA
jgi:predicted glycosyltransferase